jgi:Zn-dependent peptidase ImmA (M78 family)/DNA-binding XRE family transcriptional regulator
MSYSPLNFDAFVGRQIALARKAKGLTQEQLSNQLGFKDRQILSNIEKGLRKIADSDLTTLIQELDRSLDYFTDQYQLPEKQLFSWRIALDCPAKAETACEQTGRGLISAYMQFSDLLKCKPSPILPQLSVDQNSTYEEVRALGEYLADYWQIAESPGKSLAETFRKLNVALFYLDCPNSVSGASFRSDRLCAVFINLTHPLGRQHFSMAHELFHVLTWSTLRPDHVATSEEHHVKSKAEKLADCFASSLLMPAKTVLPLWEKRGDCSLKGWLETTAKTLEVSPNALFWRFKTLKKVKKEDYPKHWDLPRHWEGTLPQPKLYSQELAEMTHSVLKQGLVSARKTARLLNLYQEDLDDFLQEHSFAMPFGI